ncbi:hypothetical protein AVEN_85995-1 [Araneus ventricosus]|uniref:Monocarboxylate transporter 12 n=1 Tax=Araneus ventricosus TaxID=182803 RepID=A0A4Y2TMU3_ARAVE|nr:hypothetical protein AVEN_85995-1 [Araneus ventricosus]
MDYTDGIPMSLNSNWNGRMDIRHIASRVAGEQNHCRDCEPAKRLSHAESKHGNPLCEGGGELCGSPLVGFSVKLFGLRAVTISGCVFSAIGIAGCFFAEDIITVTILWGVVYGISFGFGTLSIPHYLSLHFSKHLDKANGLGLAGDTVGYFLLSLIAEYSLVTYGLSGTFLIISGMVLHSIPAAFLMKLPKKTHHQTELDSSTDECERREIPNDLKEVNSSSATNYNAIKTAKQTSAVNVFRVFLDPVYILIVFTQSAFMYIYSTTFTILIDVSRDRGVSIDHEVYLFLSISVAELFGRLFLGSITDGGYLTKLNFSALGFAVLGLLYVFIIWIGGTAVMMAFGFFFGLVASGLGLVSGGLVTFYIDKEYHSIAVPSRYILYPPVSFTQAPLIGKVTWDEIREISWLPECDVLICNVAPEGTFVTVTLS